MVGLEIRILLEKEKRKEFLHAFELLSKLQDENDACVEKILYENVSEASSFIWVEHWTDVKALNTYLSSDNYRSLLGAIDVLGELESQQIVEFSALPDK